MKEKKKFGCMEVCKTMIKGFGKHCNSLQSPRFMLINRAIGKLLHVYVQCTVAVIQTKTGEKVSHSFKLNSHQFDLESKP